VIGSGWDECCNRDYKQRNCMSEFEAHKDPQRFRRNLTVK